MVSGGMVVDYSRDQLVVASRSGSAQPSLWFVSTLDGSLKGSLSLGDIDQPVSVNAAQTVAYVVTNAGVAHALDLASRTVVWSSPVGSPNMGLWPAAGAFYLTTSDGWLKKYQDRGTLAPSLIWQRSIPGVAGVSATSGKLYAGSSDGKLRQLDPATGVIESSRALYGGSGTVGTPTVDDQTGRVQVGTLDGRVCVFAVPF
jgi:hypothetical protein